MIITNEKFVTIRDLRQGFFIGIAISFLASILFISFLFFQHKSDLTYLSSVLNKVLINDYNYFSEIGIYDTASLDNIKSSLELKQYSPGDEKFIVNIKEHLGEQEITFLDEIIKLKNFHLYFDYSDLTYQELENKIKIGTYWIAIICISISTLIRIPISVRANKKRNLTYEDVDLGVDISMSLLILAVVFLVGNEVLKNYTINLSEVLDSFYSYEKSSYIYFTTFLPYTIKIIVEVFTSISSVIVLLIAIYDKKQQSKISEEVGTKKIEGLFDTFRKELETKMVSELKKMEVQVNNRKTELDDFKRHNEICKKCCASIELVNNILLRDKKK
ncbi:hypothetical protein EDC18_10542 [Natranaerovirga pectinivora]|uniref:Uncharacterized protein n=1 Tax=Natranaerovirga pectinivora TaxID=682400 RepID=A0A4R3MK30_9FIRM|nr:hypothetical protein [Natranaerovirga pectinivora]TCT14561.1 hypothetical protein EDC18_10542 [Natranaerovirga pectinivora]